MSKKKRRPKLLLAKQRSALSVTESVLVPAQANLGDEVDNICRLASRRECRVIGFSKLVFFSTATRDAWMLDWEDELAICLMKNGMPQPYELGETDRAFAIQWRGRYHIEGQLYTYIDNATPTHARVIHGYPTEAVLHTIERMNRGI